MTAQQYQVVGAVAWATTAGQFGPERRCYSRHAILPPDVKPEEIRHLLGVKLIAPVAAPVPAPAATAAEPQPDQVDGDAPPSGVGGDPAPDTGPDSADPEVEAKRDEARGKLPADGSMPDGRAGQAVWVEWLVGQGYDYVALAREDKATLVEMAKGLVR